jgi:hypothetical protein
MLQPFPQLVHKKKFTGFDLDVVLPFCEKAVDFPDHYIDLEQGPTAISSVRNESMSPMLHGEFQSYYDWLVPIAMDIITEDWKLRNDLYYYVDSSWFNRHKRGDRTLEHNHGWTVMAVSCYITCPPNSGRIEFKDPCEINWRGSPKKNEIHQGWFPVDIETNDVLMFPGWMDHRTEVSNADEDRWVLTSNISCFSVHSKS